MNNFRSSSVSFNQNPYTIRPNYSLNSQRYSDFSSFSIPKNESMTINSLNNSTIFDGLSGQLNDVSFSQDPGVIRPLNNEKYFVGEIEKKDKIIAELREKIKILEDTLANNESNLELSFSSMSNLSETHKKENYELRLRLAKMEIENAKNKQIIEELRAELVLLKKREEEKSKEVEEGIKNSEEQNIKIVKTKLKNRWK